MTAPVAVVRRCRDREAVFDMIWMFCPGCDDAHAVPVTGPNAWTFNGNVERPTLAPSLLCRIGDRVCHSFVRDGRWEFLGDCTHALRGQTVAMPALPDWILR